MFLFTEMRYQLFRNPKRSVLMLCISVLLVSCMVFYLGNIQSNENALAGLSDAIPVQVHIFSHNGKSRTSLNIDKYYHDALVSADVKDVKSRAVLAGAVTSDAKAQEPFWGGDTKILAVNDISAAKDIESDAVMLTNGWDVSFLSGNQPICLVQERYAARHGFVIGDQITMDIYAVTFGMVTKYKRIGTHTLEIIGTFERGDSDLLAPVQWVREVTDAAGTVSFCYESLSVTLNNPMELNAFKAEMREKGFLELDPASTAENFGDVLSVEDQLFIETAEKLQQNLQVFRRFLIPFFTLIILLITLVIFLTLRSAQREMAISGSLGCSRLHCAGVYFSSTMLLSIAACGMILPVMIRFTAVPLTYILIVCGLYLVCAAVGTGLALLFLLRFDTLALLAKVD